MRVGVIGGGIIGTAIAASIKKYDYSKTIQVTIIDDKRSYQTSQAGQGYLWSIHRCEFDKDQEEEELLRSKNLFKNNASERKRLFSSLSPFEYSKKAKEIWIKLLGDHAASLLLEKRGSMLVAPLKDKEELLEYYEHAKTFLGNDLTYLQDASTCNEVLLPSISGIHYQGDDYTCSPPALIDALMEIYDLDFEYRTVTNLENEKVKYDHVICCTGPWINELKKLGVKPIRGILLQLSPGDALRMVNKMSFDSFIPMMQFGYGSLGVHFTLSSRNGNWLLGASREEVSFSSNNIDGMKQKLIERSQEFVKNGVLGDIRSEKLGFRPSCIQTDCHPFKIHCEDNVIFCYGFEGQGVLYAALAGKEVENMLLSGDQYKEE